MHLHSETPPLTGSIVRNGGSVFSKAVTPFEYAASAKDATEIAAAIVAARFRISPCMARVVCELAQIGGRVG